MAICSPPNFAESRDFFALIVLYILATARAPPPHAGTFQRNEHMWMRLIVIGLCAPLIWTRKRLFHWLAAIVVLAIMPYVSSEAVLH